MSKNASASSSQGVSKTTVLLGSAILATITIVAVVAVQRKKTLKATAGSSNSSVNNTPATAVSKVPVLKFYLDYKTSPEKTNSGLCHIARVLCPEYFADQIDEQMKTEQIQGGITNLLWKVTNDRGQSCLIRAYGENTEVLIDREAECGVFYELSKRKFGPNLWGRFTNGRVEGYFDAKPLDPSSKMGERSPVDFPVLIARQLARMHDIDDMPVKRESQMWAILDKFYKLAKNINFNRSEMKNRQFIGLDIGRYEQELEWLQTVLPSPLNDHGRQLTGVSDKVKAIAFRQVFSHNDLLSGNILYLPNENRCQFIDFEYGAYNYAAFDIADHFCEYAGFEFDLQRWYPNEELQKHFWRAYLEAEKFKLEPNEEEAVLNELVLWTNRFALLAHLMWFFWAIVQGKHSVIDVDFLAYAGRRRDGYLLHKQQFFPGA